MQMRHVWCWASLVTGAVLASHAQAQSAATAAINQAPAVASAVGPVAPQRTLWSFLGCSWEQKEACRREICKMPIGQMLNNATAPLGAMTGGLLPSFCPQTPSAEQLADKGAVGAAAKIQADEAAAKERRAAVRYLGTVDCHYWPEAGAALIAALRSDRNECVRYEAALALANGCCCNKATIEALIIVLSCSDRDNFPKETSARVHAAARVALDKCLSCFEHVTPVKNIENPEKQDNNKKQENPEKAGQPTPKTAANAPRKLNEPKLKGEEYYASIEQQPMEPIVREGRRVLAATVSRAIPVSSGNSLARLFDRASGTPQTQGYIVQGGLPGQAEVVASSKPSNLWEMMTGRSQPVVVSSYPARSVVVTPDTQRVVAQPLTVPATTAPAMPLPTAAATVATPVQQPSVVVPHVQVQPAVTVPTVKPAAPAILPPPAMPGYNTAPTSMQSVVPTPAPRMPTMPAVVPTTTVMNPPVVKPAPAPVPAPSKPAVPVAAAPKTPAAVETRPVAKTMPAVQPVQATTVQAAPKVPVLNGMQTTIQKISMGQVHERIIALESLTTFDKATPELASQLIMTAEQDSQETVRCAAIRAMVRTGVRPERAIPVLAQLGMQVDTAVGKEANQALAQINLQLVNGSK